MVTPRIAFLFGENAKKRMAAWQRQQTVCGPTSNGRNGQQRVTLAWREKAVAAKAPWQLLYE